MNMEAHMPAANVLTVLTPIKVQGTGTPCDQIHFPRQVTREMSVEAMNTSRDESPDQ
jgi:hypothetical protein